MAYLHPRSRRYFRNMSLEGPIAGNATACTFDAKDYLRFPFEYRNSTGGLVRQGIEKIIERGKRVCVFPTDVCQAELNGNASSALQCCRATDALQRGADHWLEPMITFFVVYIGLLQIKKCKNKEIAATSDPTQPFDWKKKLLGAVYMLAIVALVMEATLMPQSIQNSLSPSDRAAQIAMQSFLTPVAQIFAFLEDAVAIKVGYALASGRLAEVNLLLNASAMGGLVSGCVAFLLMLLLALNDSSAAVLLNPAAASTSQAIAAGCGLLPTTAQLLDSARVYWLLVAASWMPQLAVKGAMGLLIGTGNLTSYMLPLVFQGAVPMAVWFGLRSSPAFPPLVTLGVAYGVADWLTMLFVGGTLACNASFRQQYKLKWLGCCLGGRGCKREGVGKESLQRGSNAAVDVCHEGSGTHMSASLAAASGGEEEKEDVWAAVAGLAREGAKLMVLDVTVQLSITVTIYLAASQSFESLYKLSAPQAAYWTLGPSYVVGLMLFLKVQGGKLIASGNTKRFRAIFLSFGLIVVAMATCALVLAVQKRRSIAFVFGESACIFAADERCAGIYGNIFGGSSLSSAGDGWNGDSLAGVFEVFGPAVFLQMLFELFRSGLATCHDFTFLYKSSVLVLLLVYLPAILLAHLHFRTAVSYFIAMYAPHVVLVFVFAIRMAQHLRCMARCLPGPWSSFAIKRQASNDQTPLLAEQPE